ncbi:hypothetical protein [Devriesea agamarum]|uniref:hypothetical protein n=1 Tax=Devriesea agamarum TaxID=472569 RepID=UPI0018D2A300|nr:hypothetical protein [Devriesea agamarum]
MNRIDELIQELCPDYVRHVALSEIADYSSTRVDAADLDETIFAGVDNLVAERGSCRCKLPAEHRPSDLLRAGGHPTREHSSVSKEGVASDE